MIGIDFLKYLFIYLFRLRRVWTLSCGMRAGSSSPTRDQTQAPCIASVESYPLAHQGSPGIVFLNAHNNPMKKVLLFPSYR